MSTSEEIQAVFADDIERKSRIVRGKYGIIPFLRGTHDLRVKDILPYSDELRKIQVGVAPDEGEGASAVNEEWQGSDRRITWEYSFWE